MPNLPPDSWVQRTAAEYAQAWAALLPTGPAWPRDPTQTPMKVVTGLAGIWGTEVEALAALLLTVESDPRATNILLPDWERAFGLPDPCAPTGTDNPSREAALVAKMTFLGAQSRAFFIAQAANIAGQTITIREYAPYMCGVSKCGDTSNYNTDGPSNFTAATNASTSTSSAVLSFAAVNTTIIPGMMVTDVTTGNIIGMTSSFSVASNTVTLQFNALFAVGSGDTLFFSNHMRWQLGPPENRFYWTVRVTTLLSNFMGADVSCLLRRWKPAHTVPVFDYSPLQDLDVSRSWDSGYLALL